MIINVFIMKIKQLVRRRRHDKIVSHVAALNIDPCMQLHERASATLINFTFKLSNKALFMILLKDFAFFFFFVVVNYNDKLLCLI